MPTSPTNKVPRGTRRTSAGFTLLEILLVLALVAGAMTMMAAAFTRGSDGPRLRAATAQMANGLRDARARALLEQKVQRFELEPAAHRWQAAGGKPQPVPEAIALSMSTAAELRTPRGGAILFFPDGGATGGRVTLAAERAAWSVDVAWLTGEVRVSRETIGAAQ